MTLAVKVLCYLIRRYMGGRTPPLITIWSTIVHVEAT